MRSAPHRLGAADVQLLLAEPAPGDGGEPVQVVAGDVELGGGGVDGLQYASKAGARIIPFLEKIAFIFLNVELGGGGVGGLRYVPKAGARTKFANHPL